MARKLPTIISKEEFDKLIEAVDSLEHKTKGKIKKQIYKQYKAIMILQGHAGLRISEALGLWDYKSRCCDAEVEQKRGEK